MQGDTTSPNIDLSDLVEGTLTGLEWEVWLLAHPDQAVEVATARRVRALMQTLRESSVTVPADFEARVMDRLRADATQLDLLDLGLAGVGRVLIELLNIIFGGFPAQLQPNAA